MRLRVQASPSEQVITRLLRSQQRRSIDSVSRRKYRPGGWRAGCFASGRLYVLGLVDEGLAVADALQRRQQIGCDATSQSLPAAECARASAYLGVRE